MGGFGFTRVGGLAILPHATAMPTSAAGQEGVAVRPTAIEGRRVDRRAPRGWFRFGRCFGRFRAAVPCRAARGHSSRGRVGNVSFYRQFAGWSTDDATGRWAAKRG